MKKQDQDINDKKKKHSQFECDHSQDLNQSFISALQKRDYAHWTTASESVQWLQDNKKIGYNYSFHEKPNVSMRSTFAADREQKLNRKMSQPDISKNVENLNNKKRFTEKRRSQPTVKLTKKNDQKEDIILELLKENNRLTKLFEEMRLSMEQAEARERSSTQVHALRTELRDTTFKIKEMESKLAKKPKNSLDEVLQKLDKFVGPPSVLQVENRSLKQKMKDRQGTIM